MKRTPSTVIPNMSQYPAGKRGKEGLQGFVCAAFSTLLAKSHRLSTSYGSDACSANESLPSLLPSLPGVRLHLNPSYQNESPANRIAFTKLYPPLAQFRTPNVKVLI